MITRENSRLLSTLTWIMLWASLFITFAIFLPGFSEFDTYKYLTIAQDMIKRHDYLLAYWDGQPYSDKPPLLFWLMILGWKIFGFSNTWPQLIVLALATTSILLSQRIAKMFWPSSPNCSQLVPLYLIGCFFWVWFAREIRVDAILVLATLLSLYSLIQCTQNKNKYWLLYILAVGLGGFAKGPVILVFILPPAIFLPALLNAQAPFSLKWYGLLGFMTILGLCIPLAWAIPAALSGGKIFSNEIFYNQISHRATQHRESLFFYITRLPLWLLPWSIYPPVWRGIKFLNLRQRPCGENICLILLCSGILVFSFFGQKLPHYLYPLFPIFSILIARLCSLDPSFRHKDQWGMAFLLIFFGLFCLFYTIIAHWLPHNAYIRGYFLQEINLKFWGSLFFLIGLLLLIARTRNPFTQVMLIATMSVLLALFVNNIVLLHYRQHINDNLILKKLETIPHDRLVIVGLNDIHDDKIIHYLQQHPIQEIPPLEIQQWKTLHPNGWFLTPNFLDLKQRNSDVIWCYQSRFSIISLAR